MSGRWDLLLDKKPVPLVEHLVDEVAKLLAAELLRWPLSVQELDVGTGRRFAPLLEPGNPRPSDAVFSEAFRLARWELEREIEAVDDYMRNQRWTAQGLSAQDKLALLFVSRWLVEQMLGLGEATQGRLSRRALADCLDRARRLWKT
jgi:hypothetical protein